MVETSTRQARWVKRYRHNVWLAAGRPEYKVSSLNGLRRLLVGIDALGAPSQWVEIGSVAVLSPL
jgi:hypothetical protein